MSAIIGAILGDISGSAYEFDRTSAPETCPLFSKRSDFTDDTVMTLAVKYAIDKNIPYDEAMRLIGTRYPDVGYGNSFIHWLFSDKPKPYNSWGNGSAMRVSYVGEHFDTLEDVVREAKRSAEVTHNHPEGIKGAVVTASSIWMARHGKTKQEIHDYVASQYPGDKYKWHIDSDMEDLKANYTWDVSCQGSVPVAMKFVVESDDFESFLRKVFSLECDADTLGAIGGAVAAELYGTGLPEDELIDIYLDSYLKSILYGTI